MSLLTIPRLHRGGATARNAFMLLLPHGGQSAARRNAWAGMSRDAAAGRARQEAAEAVLDSLARHGQQQVTLRHGTGR